MVAGGALVGSWEGMVITRVLRLLGGLEFGAIGGWRVLSQLWGKERRGLAGSASIKERLCTFLQVFEFNRSGQDIGRPITRNLWPERATGDKGHGEILICHVCREIRDVQEWFVKVWVRLLAISVGILRLEVVVWIHLD